MLLRAELCPLQKKKKKKILYIEILSPTPEKVTVFGNGVFKDMIKLKSGH